MCLCQAHAHCLHSTPSSSAKLSGHKSGTLKAGWKYGSVPELFPEEKLHFIAFKCI